MNRTERLTAVLDLLAVSGRVEVDDIVHRLGVSVATARRDLDALAQQQLLTRTRGGAIAHSVAYDLPLRYKNQQRPEEKLAIARAAVALIPRGAVIGLCGGTTTTAIADALTSRPDIMEPASDPGLTVVTNAINIGMLLSPRPQIKTVMTGGVVHARSYELVGSYADAVIGSISLDIAFIGANGLDAEVGPTCHDEQEAAVNAVLAARARRAVVVTDSAKIDRRAFATIGPRDLFSTIVTDDSITTEQLRRLEESGYEVIVAG
ncbi:DeoR/GlpR family DNA-binding transcription regulator [Agromyces mangrovi Wang et al. 2018]|uniref:DeoR/GlpR family DNA-binding transcription regulator n=1 Tax=Agromyces mangrovi TaxID=1858653 RepID=UPI0025726CF9|nr:DeoR/GlpR family DNA-binding transcription regulator [Agromyces mangrovi]BDZ65201.1 transcriptional regulator [Agromyces mangrovi]